jgi:hypothetical protein
VRTRLRIFITLLKTVKFLVVFAFVSALSQHSQATDLGPLPKTRSSMSVAPAAENVPNECLYDFLTKNLGFFSDGHSFQKNQGLENAGIHFYTDEQGEERVRKALPIGTHLPDAIYRVRLMEEENGPSFFGHGTVKIDGHTHPYIDIEAVGPKGSFVIAKECRSRCFESFTQEQTEAISREIADRLFKALIHGKYAGDPDFAIRLTDGAVRWFDPGHWNAIRDYSTESEFYYRFGGVVANAGVEIFQKSPVTDTIITEFFTALKKSSLSEEKKYQVLLGFADEMKYTSTYLLPLLEKQPSVMAQRQPFLNFDKERARRVIAEFYDGLPSS